jgi:hypothetical protein
VILRATKNVIKEFAVADWARFWAVDLHVHTPGSRDVKPENFGSASDIVSAAIAAGLDAIATTTPRRGATTSRRQPGAVG